MWNRMTYARKKTTLSHSVFLRQPQYYFFSSLEKKTIKKLNFSKSHKTNNINKLGQSFSLSVVGTTLVWKIRLRQVWFLVVELSLSLCGLQFWDASFVCLITLVVVDHRPLHHHHHLGSFYNLQLHTRPGCVYNSIYFYYEIIITLK